MSSPAPNYHPPPPPPQTLHSPPIPVVLTVVLLIFFLLGFFSIYFCRCFMEALFNTWNLRRTPSGNLIRSGNNADVLPAHTGLDPMLIKSFPTLVYSSIKEVRKEKYGLECAICLLEFEDDSLLRLLTACYHVFHQECVDLWLESHKTCPVCRRDLDSPHIYADKSSEPPPVTNNNGTGIVIDVNAIAIDINDDVSQPPIFGRSTMKSGNVGEAAPKRRTGGTSGANNGIAERFPRSHSTGHSIARARPEEENRDQDRYRLRLPEHVKMKLLRGHHWTGSCETYGEFHRHRSCTSPNAVGRRLGEVSGSSDH